LNFEFANNLDANQPTSTNNLDASHEQLRLLRLQEAVDRVLIVAVDLDLLQDGKGHRIGAGENLNKNKSKTDQVSIKIS
jgi:hypothetical protein